MSGPIKDALDTPGFFESMVVSESPLDIAELDLVDLVSSKVFVREEILLGIINQVRMELGDGGVLLLGEHALLVVVVEVDEHRVAQVQVLALGPVLQQVRV